MTYLRRALKYFIQISLILAVILLILMVSGMVSWDMNIAFQHGWKSVWWILAAFAAMSLAYPFFGYQKRKINVVGDPADYKEGIVKALATRGYVLEDDTDGERPVRHRVQTGGVLPDPGRGDQPDAGPVFRPDPADR